jgi:amidase
MKDERARRACDKADVERAPMNRRDVLLFTGALAAACSSREEIMAETRGAEPAELGIAELQAQLTAGKLTSRALVRRYVKRIEALDRSGPKLRAVLELNPDADSIAEALDRERKEKGKRGPLHGIPILIKDNIDTADRMTTTAGSLALEGWIPPEDAFLVRQLRAAGAVILGKTNLSEWANYRSSRSSSGWSGRGGQTRHPYALERNPSGSSSGSAVAAAAGLCAAAVGTETDGSIVSPANACGIVGLKPTLGLISRTGVIPIAHSQDTAGPMARTVADAAALLSALTGVDPRDKATADSKGHGLTDYSRFLDKDGLRGARLGVARQFVGANRHVDALFERALADLKRQGAVLVDLAEIPNLFGFGATESEVLSYEFKADLNAYLARLPSGRPRSLKELIAFNEREKDREMPYFGQETFLRSEARGPLTDPAYLDALAKNHRLTREEGLDVVFKAERLDAVIAPTGGPAGVTDLIYGGGGGVRGPSSVAAVSGYPHLTVPTGYIFGLPVGLSFIGKAWSEGRLLQLGYAYEQATHHRKPPEFLPHTPVGS